MNDERRKYPRISLNQCIQISFGRETFIDAEAVNISQNGILCSTSEPIEDLDRIFLMIDIPIMDEIKTIQCEGIPMYTESVNGKTQFGIQFIEIDEDSSDILKHYLELNI